MFNHNSKIKYNWQRLKAQTSRLFAMVKFLLVTCFVGLMFVISHYVQLRAFVLSILDEKTVSFIKQMVSIFYGSSSVLFALEQTFIIVAMPAIGLLLRAVFTHSFVSLVLWLICAVCKVFSCDSNVILHAQPQCECPTHFSNRWLTLCKFIS